MDAEEEEEEAAVVAGGDELEWCWAADAAAAAIILWWWWLWWLWWWWCAAAAAAAAWWWCGSGLYIIPAAYIMGVGGENVVGEEIAGGLFAHALGSITSAASHVYSSSSIVRSRKPHLTLAKVLAHSHVCVSYTTR